MREVIVYGFTFPGADIECVGEHPQCLRTVITEGGDTCLDVLCGDLSMIFVDELNAGVFIVTSTCTAGGESITRATA